MNKVNKEKWMDRFREKPKGRPPLPVKVRFEKFIDKTETCWLWTGHIGHNEYGTFKHNYKKSLAHRVAYELYIDAIPKGLVIDHKCRVRNCVNPDHLEAVTNAENLARRPEFVNTARNGRRYIVNQGII